jgi:hypothetical protein
MDESGIHLPSDKRDELEKSPAIAETGCRATADNWRTPLRDPWLWPLVGNARSRVEGVVLWALNGDGLAAGDLLSFSRAIVDFAHSILTGPFL